MNDITRMIFTLVFAVSTGYVIFNAPIFYKVFVIGGMVIITGILIFKRLNGKK
jgi:hypothetical protein